MSTYWGQDRSLGRRIRQLERQQDAQLQQSGSRANAMASESVNNAGGPLSLCSMAFQQAEDLATSSAVSWRRQDGPIRASSSSCCAAAATASGALSLTSTTRTGHHCGRRGLSGTAAPHALSRHLRSFVAQGSIRQAAVTGFPCGTAADPTAREGLNNSMLDAV